MIFQISQSLHLNNLKIKLKEEKKTETKLKQDFHLKEHHRFVASQNL